MRSPPHRREREDAALVEVEDLSNWLVPDFSAERGFALTEPASNPYLEVGHR
jgi:hypothetical protein